jgi:halimadienyl-diphosphate synthase
MVFTEPKILSASLPLQGRGIPMQSRIQELLTEIGPGIMSNVAYDTAWVARLGEIDSDLSDRALFWLREHQLPDGSWGAVKPAYYHDRLVSTLAAMIALINRDPNARDRMQIGRGLLALETIIDNTSPLLKSDPEFMTVGFEMIAPTLVREAERLGILKQKGDKILERISYKRSQKLSHIKGKMINRNVTVAHSAEMAGIDGQEMLDIDNLQAENGSIGCSPSATSYFALNVRQGDKKALEYLNGICGEDGGVPNVAPIDIFEVAWALWNLSMIPADAGMKTQAQRHVDFLSKTWDNRNGAGFSSGFSVNDSDDSSIVFDTLSRYGITKPIDSILIYEEKDWFRCFDLENDPSISANIHLLGAFRQAGYQRNHPAARKILQFLQKTRSNEGNWKDKWHISPYYVTAHAIMACAGYASEIAAGGVDWILRTQKQDGSWGVFGPTAEETAYALQALWVWSQRVQYIPSICLKKGKMWLEDHQEDEYIPLWIGKCLYSPKLVIDSVIINALCLLEQ